MRDLYHRQQRLAYWIKRVNTDLEEPDRIDVLKLVEHMQDRERAVLWIMRCITALLLMRRQLGRPFRDATRGDIRSILKWMEEKGYKASTNEKFRQVLKLFYKTVYGNSECYPEQVKWFPVKLGKEKTGKESSMDMAEYLEEEEVQKVIESAPTIQKKTFLACMYESGACPEEFLRLTNTDIRIDSKGAVLMLRGKTGERRVRVISFSKLLQQWLEVHPLRYENHYPIWISEATNFKNKALGLRGAQKIIEQASPRSGLHNKHARLYILRHSRATHLAKHLTEAQMCTFFGWVVGTQVVRRYVHLSGKDVDSTLLALAEGEQMKTTEYKLKSLKCKRCSEMISPTMNFCSKCALPVDLNNEYTREMVLENENMGLREKLDQGMKAMREEMNQKFNQIMSVIQENPRLSHVKPEVLAMKIEERG
ncbi:MAG: tyrosine-type recombinase/integrase [Thermoproteota archaeon]|nr:tyrosine-type recombinase/integrase [Thermoproteota archaeon]